jgi:hypothetical protein
MSAEFVYIATCLEFKHPENDKPLIKIGLSKEGIEERMSGLSKETGVPGTYICLYYFECDDCFSIEGKLHNIFADLRYKESKEFFVVNPESVAKCLEHMPGKLYKYDEIPKKTVRKKRRKKPSPEPNDDKKAKILRMHNSRWNQRQISEKLKVSKYHVAKTIKSHNDSNDIATT